MLLRPDDIGSHTVQQLWAFLKTRGVPAPYDSSKNGHVTAVRNILDLERAKIAKGDRIQIRDPSGTSLHRHLIATRPELLRSFPQLDPDLNPPVDGWTTEMEDINGVAPILEKGVMKAFYVSKLRTPEATGKVWHSGYKRIVNLSSVSGFYYHGPTAEKPSMCWVRFPVPASMKATKYPVIVAMEFVPKTPASEDGIVPATPALVTNIISIRCVKCVAGAGGEYPFCIHGAATLFVLYNLPREKEEEEAYVPSTSRLCRWNVPGNGEAYDVEKPIAFMPFTKDEEDKPVKRHSAARSDEGQRRDYVSYSPADLPKNKRETPSRMIALHKLHAILRRDLKDNPCASEVQWG